MKIDVGLGEYQGRGVLYGYGMENAKQKMEMRVREIINKKKDLTQASNHLLSIVLERATGTDKW